MNGGASSGGTSSGGTNSGAADFGAAKISAANVGAAHSTRFVVAQRISTVLKAEVIIVLDDGVMAAQGTHRELLQSSPIYREIYQSQLGNGGLAHGSP